MPTSFSRSEEEREKIASVSMQIVEMLSTSGLTQQDMTVSLGFAAKIILADALSRSKAKRPTEATIEIAKDALNFGFEQEVRVATQPPSNRTH